MTEEKKKREGNPIWLGMKLFWDPEWDYSFWHEIRWKQFKFEDGRPGIIFTPHDDYHPLTSFSVQPRDLETEITGDDLPTLTEGFVAGLMGLPDCQIESQEESVTGSLVILDARFTFTEDGETRKRWVQLVYKGTRQYLLIGQGGTVEDFEWWLPMFFMAMNTFVIGPRFDLPGGWPPLAYRMEEEKKRMAELEKQLEERLKAKKAQAEQAKKAEGEPPASAESAATEPEQKAEGEPPA